VTDETRALAEELRLLEDGAGWLALGGDCLVRVTGESHREVLQRVLSQDVLPLRPGEAALALLLAPKGQFRAIMAVFAGAKECYLLTPPGRGPGLARCLDTYLRISRCTAEPGRAPELLAVLGNRWREAAAAAGGAPPEDGWTAISETLWFGKTLFGIPGAVVAPAKEGALASLREKLRVAGARPLSEEAVELARIRTGFPAWGAELTETVLPPEAGIGEEAISYSKGCYVGQETIARMRTYGHPTRQVVGVRQLTGGAERPPLPLALAAAGEAKARGSLTSWARHPERGAIGIAMVRRELTEPGTRLGGDGREFEVAHFPLW
jgi:folate-binding protein YgfZ